MITCTATSIVWFSNTVVRLLLQLINIKANQLWKTAKIYFK